MAAQNCKQLLQLLKLQKITIGTRSLKTLSATFSHAFLAYSNQRPYHLCSNFPMATKWADGPFPLIGTPEFRLKVR